MKAATGETIALHLQRDGPAGLHTDPEAAARMDVQGGQLIPRVGAEVVLPTKGYKLLKNVKVEEVQISAVSAPGGGLVYRIE